VKKEEVLLKLALTVPLCLFFLYEQKNLKEKKEVQLSFA